MGAYTALVIDTRLVRQTLRVLRKRYFRNNRLAAEASGLSAFTVAKIENLKSWPDYDPGIGIVLKLLGAMKMPLVSFVEELRTLDARFDALKLSDRVGQTPTDSSLAPTDTVNDDALPTLTRQEIANLRALARVIRSQSDELHAAEERADEKDHEAIERDRGSHRRYAPDNHLDKTSPAPSARKRHAGDPRRRQGMKRRPKKKPRGDDHK